LDFQVFEGVNAVQVMVTFLAFFTLLLAFDVILNIPSISRKPFRELH